CPVRSVSRPEDPPGPPGESGRVRTQGRRAHDRLGSVEAVHARVEVVVPLLVACGLGLFPCLFGVVVREEAPAPGRFDHARIVRVGARHLLRGEMGPPMVLGPQYGQDRSGLPSGKALGRKPWVGCEFLCTEVVTPPHAVRTICTYNMRTSPGRSTRGPANGHSCTTNRNPWCPSTAG